MIPMKAILNRNIYGVISRAYSVKITSNNDNVSTPTENFEPVFKFPFIKNISIFHRLKVYQIIASAVAIPGCGALEVLNVVPDNSTVATAYVGITGIALLCLASIPTINTIGFIYISDDEKQIKISSLDFWGRRINKVIDSNDWVPVTELPSNKMDFLYLSPQLEDGTRYKLFARYGKVLNTTKMGRVLE